MKKPLLAVVLAAAVAITLSASGAAQDAGTNHSQPHFSGQAPGEAQAILRKYAGSISAVDPKAMTLNIKSTEGCRAFKVTAKTKFSRGDKPALFQDVSVGKNVEAVIKMVHGQPDEIITVNIKDK
jgi:hypothetical protein